MPSCKDVSCQQLQLYVALRPSQLYSVVISAVVKFMPSRDFCWCLVSFARRHCRMIESEELDWLFPKNVGEGAADSIGVPKAYSRPPMFWWPEKDHILVCL